MYMSNFGTKTLELVAQGDFWIILWILWVWGWTQYLDGLFEPVRAWSKSVQLGLRSPSLWTRFAEYVNQFCDPSLWLKLKFVISFAWASLWGDWPVRVIRCSVGVQVEFYGPYVWSTECRQEVTHGNDLALEPPVSLLCDVTFLLLLYSYWVTVVTWHLRFCPCLLTKHIAYPVPFVFLSRGRRGDLWALTLVLVCHSWTIRMFVFIVVVCIRTLLRVYLLVLVVIIRV